MKSISGAIIAGGKSTRMGVDKAMIKLNQDTFLQKAISLIASFTNNIFISSNRSYPKIDFPIIKDTIIGIGPLGGIQAILKAIPTQKVLLIPVDTPLLNEKVIQYILDNSDFEKEIIICKTHDGVQMLIGIYDVSLLPLIENQIKSKDYKLSNLLKKANVQIIEIDDFKEFFVNINTKIELNDLQNKAKI